MYSNLSPLQKIGIALIVMYQKSLSRLTHGCCRFTPSCSEYTKQAIAIHGFFKGCFICAYRILRCNPLNPGGYDPVPPRKVKVKKQRDL